MSTTIYLLDQPPVIIEEKSWETVVRTSVSAIEGLYIQVIKKISEHKYIVCYFDPNEEVMKGFLLLNSFGDQIFTCIDRLAEHLFSTYPYLLFEIDIENAVNELKKNYPPVKI